MSNITDYASPSFATSSSSFYSSSSSSPYASSFPSSSTDHNNLPQTKVVTLIPPPEIIKGIPNFFLFEGMWAVKFFFPLSLIIQTIGHILVLRLYHQQKTRLKCDSKIFLINYIISDSLFVVFIVVTYSLTFNPRSCPVAQILYDVSITLPIYAVSLITFKR